MAGYSLSRQLGNAIRYAPAYLSLDGTRRGELLGWAIALAGALDLGFLAAAPSSLAQPLGGTECSDTIDNDADGIIDLADAGCLADLLRDDETGELVVNSTLDKVDANPGDGLCETQVIGECTVRAAIMETNATPGEQGVQVPAGTFELTIAPVDPSTETADGDLDITDDLVLIGAGAENTRIGGASQLSPFSDRVFEILPSTQVTISGVTAEYGYALVCGGGLAGCNGGGIFNAGTLVLTNTSVSGNRAVDTGGGIYAVGFLMLTNSTVSGNYASYDGGGIYIGNGGTLTMANSTVSGNSNSYYADGGAGVSNEGTTTLINSTVSGNYAWFSGGGGIRNDDIMTLTNSTVSGNYARYGGGGIFNAGTLALMNTSVSGNEAPFSGSDGIFNTPTGYMESINSIIAANGIENCGCGFGSPPPPCDLLFVSSGHNLSDDTTCFAAAGTDLVVANAMLSPLQDNGGPTETHALLAGSPAIDAGSPDCPPPTTDQRGVARPQGAACDIGAVEFVPEPGSSMMLVAGTTLLALLYRRRTRGLRLG